MKLHCFEHTASEGLGTIAAWAKQNGHEIMVSRPASGDPFPNLDGFDALILFGGDFSLSSEFSPDWLAAEKVFLKTVVASDKKILALSQGAALLAEILGGKVIRAKFKEVGWFTLEIPSEASNSAIFKDLPSPFLAFEWHTDTFTLPPHATAVVRGNIVANQGFLVADRMLGLQFHPEITFEIVADWIKSRSQEMAEALKEPYIQRPYQMLASPERFTANDTWFFTILDRFLAGKKKKVKKAT